MNKLCCLIITVNFSLTSCDTRSGSECFESGLTNYKLGDHGDYHEDEWLKKANKDFEKAIDKGYKEREVFEKLAWSYFTMNDYKNAGRIYSLGIIQFPNDIEFHFRGGVCKEELHKYKEAFFDYDKVISLDSLEKYYYLNNAYYERGAMSFILGETINAEKDRAKAQTKTNYELRTYKEYCGHLMK